MRFFHRFDTIGENRSIIANLRHADSWRRNLINYIGALHTKIEWIAFENLSLDFLKILSYCFTSLIILSVAHLSHFIKAQEIKKNLNIFHPSGY